MILRKHAARHRRQRDSFMPWFQLFADAAAIYGVLFLVFWLRFLSGRFPTILSAEDYPIYYNVFHVTVFTCVFFLRAQGLYRSGRHLTYGEEAVKLFKAILAAMVVLTAASFFIRDFSFSRTFLITVWFFLWVGVALVRFASDLLLTSVDRARGSLRNVLVIGCDENAAKLVRHYRKHPRYGRKVVGFLDAKLAAGAEFEGLPVIGAPADLAQILKKHRQTHEVVLASSRVPAEEALRMIAECEKQMVQFRRIADMYGLISSKMSVTYAGGVSILSFTDSPLSDWENRFLKRLLDVALVLTAALPLLPVFVVIAFLVKKSSPGPVFYRQERIGADGRHFALLKFRTMRVGAEKASGPVWAKKDDPRRTGIGTFLRENNLDELPQLWNVLSGDMSLVGPRPERPHFVSQFKEDIPRYMARHSTRSGITGWAQVNGLRGDTSIEERTKFDLYYIENWTIFFDLKILFLTLFARRNAY